MPLVQLLSAGTSLALTAAVFVSSPFIRISKHGSGLTNIVCVCVGVGRVGVGCWLNVADYWAWEEQRYLVYDLLYEYSQHGYAPHPGRISRRYREQRQTDEPCRWGNGQGTDKPKQKPDYTKGANGHLKHGGSY